MSMDFSNVSSTGTSTISTAQDYASQIQQQSQTTPILGGMPVTITAVGDFEKLLAEAQKELNEQNIDIAQEKLSWALATITGLANGISQSQSTAMVALEIATQQLESLVEAYTITDEERADMIETEERLQAEVASLEAEIASLDMSQAGAAEKKAALEAELDSTKSSLATVQDDIAKADATKSDLEEKMAACNAAIAEATNALTDSSLAILGTAIRLTAGDVMVNYHKGIKAEEHREEVKTQVWNVLNEAFEKATADMRAEIEAKRTEMV